MTTFTLQDLTPAQQEAVEQHEAMLSAYSILNTRSINNVPTTTKEEFMEYGMNNPISASAIEYATQHAPEPQPTLCEPTQTPDLTTIINAICTQLQLLSTVISQTKAQPSTTPPEGDQPTLQETIALTLQQADWFKDMVKDEVESRVESEVESYFERRFDPTDHFDFNDAVSNEVDDRLDDVVRDRIDEAVEEQLGEVVSNKLQNLRVVFD
jgi:hypothetical protein